MGQSAFKPTCVYCGNRKGTTRDHVPPKNLFPKPRPDLITVPCCERCRQGQSLDDEYFVRMIAIRNDVGRHPAIAPVIGAIHRSFTKPSKIRFTGALLRSMKKSPVYSKAGLYLGHAPSYDVDLQRLCRVIERTTRGLYFSEFKVRLPDDHECKTYALDGFSNDNPDVARLLAIALAGKQRTFGNDVFSFWVRQIEPATLWAFVVYGRVGFMALTAPRNRR